MAQDRVVVLVDMDCFYVQVEQRANPALQGKPCAVVQYKKWKGGGIIAVGYEARACGVTRSMRGDDAKAKCPSINLVHVPEVRGKADLTRYREAGAEVIEVLSRFSKCVERASIDEAYIDMTDEVNERMERLRAQDDRITPEQLGNTWVVGWERARQIHDSGEIAMEQTEKPTDTDRRAGVSEWLHEVYEGSEWGVGNQRLAIAAQITEEMRAAVYRDTGFRCSAGIAHNKMVAKLVCGLHKPNKQTILPQDSVPELFSTMPITKVRGFGGKFGAFVTERLRVEYMADLVQFSQQHLMSVLGEKSGAWVYGVCRGIENEPVSDRQLPKSIGCSKNFAGREALNTKEKVRFWLTELSKEVEERLAKDRDTNKRIARNLIVSLHQERLGNASSHTCAIVRYDAEKFASDAFTLLKKYDTSPVTSTFWNPIVVNLSVVATKFMDIDDSAASIKSFLSKKPSAASGASPTSQLRSPGLQSQRTPMSKPKLKKRSISSFFNSASPQSPVKRNARSGYSQLESTSQKSWGSGTPQQQQQARGDVSSPQARTTHTTVQLGSTDIELSASEYPRLETSHNLMQGGASVQSQMQSPHRSKPFHTDIVPQSQSPNIAEREMNQQTSPELFASSCAGQNISNKNPTNEHSDTEFSDTELILLNTDSNKRSCTFTHAETEISSEGASLMETLPKSVEQTETTPRSEKPVKRGFFATKMLELKKKRESEDSAQNHSDGNSEKLNVHSPNAIKISNGNNDARGEIPVGNGSSHLVSNAGTSPLVADSDYSKCEECGRMVSAWDLPEHLDFHFAQKIQKEQQQQQRLELQQQQQQQQQTAAASATTQTPSSHVINNKRKLDSTKSKTSSKRSKMSSQTTGQKTLDGFFRRS